MTVRHAFGLAAAALLAVAPAMAQRATSSPSSETASGPEAVTPPPAGFPTTLGGDLTFGGDIDTHTQLDFILPHGSKPRVGLFNDTDLGLFANYRSWLSLNAAVKLERTRGNNLGSYYPDRNGVFNSEAASLRQLYVTLRPTENLSVYGGKIHPNFGSAYEQAPGIFYNFGTDYEQDERVGLGLGYSLPALLGLGVADRLGLNDTRFSLEAYYLDTSFLSQAVGSRPSLDDPSASRAYRYARGQYGPSNTGGLDSWTAALRGGKPSRGLAWQVSVTREATADPNGRTEFGQSASVTYDPNGSGIPLSPRLGVTPFLEYAHFSNFGGIAGLERNYAVAGLAFKYAKWVLNLSGGVRRSTGLSSATDHQESGSLTYEILPAFQLGAGVNFVEIDGRASRALSPSISYSRAF